MMTLLEEWRKKISWRKTLPIVPVYISKTTKGKDLDLAALFSKEKTLTLTQSGFKEVVVLPPKDGVNSEYMSLTNPLPKNFSKPETIAKELIEAIKEYFLQLWDSNKYHLMFCSGGMDSRILSWTLANLREEMGKDWIGKIHFRCHEPEGKIFKTVMAKQRWETNQYSVYKEGRNYQMDYFSLGDFSRNVNAFFRPTVEFWDDLVGREEERNVVLVNGCAGGEIFSYPQYTENKFLDLIRNLQPIRNGFSKTFMMWNDILMPYLGYDYLNVAFRVPKQYFRWTVIRGQRVDFMRSVICQLVVPDKIPFYQGHIYNLKVSKQRLNYVKKMWFQSKFYSDFKHLCFVTNAKPWLVYQKNESLKSALDLKLYGYATMYENIRMGENS